MHIYYILFAFMSYLPVLQKKPVMFCRQCTIAIHLQHHTVRTSAIRSSCPPQKYGTHCFSSQNNIFSINNGYALSGDGNKIARLRHQLSETSRIRFSCAYNFRVTGMCLVGDVYYVYTCNAVIVVGIAFMPMSQAYIRPALPESHYTTLPVSFCMNMI